MRKILIILISIILFVLCLTLVLLVPEKNNKTGSTLILIMNETMKKNLCKFKGGEWFSCSGMFGPCGCARIYKDGGKTCVKAKDCFSNVCIITGKDREINGSYIGKCPKNNFETDCGTAEIEDGKIVRDRRSCVY